MISRASLVIVERGWSTPSEMRGSWAGAMGHTQWMPEVWLNMGFDFDHDGRVSPFGSPADALASTARYLVKRGNYRPGERWGYEVKGARGGSIRAPPAGFLRLHRPCAPRQIPGAIRQPGSANRRVLPGPGCVDAHLEAAA